MTDLSIAAQDALKVYGIASRNHECSICERMQCGHTIRERLRAELVDGDQAASPRNDMAGLQRLAENVARGGPDRVSITPRQKQLLDFIRAYKAQNEGMAPTYDEMRAHLGLSSKTTIHGLVKSLEERGAIRRLPNKNRSLVIVGEAA